MTPKFAAQQTIRRVAREENSSQLCLFFNVESPEISSL